MVTNKGFSLVELMVTIAVVAVIAAMAVPSFASFRDRAQMRSTMNEMVNLIESARFESVQRDRPVTVGFDRAGDSTWCVGASENLAACDCFQPDPDADDYCDLGQFPRLLPDGGDGQAQATVATAGIRMLDEPAFNGARSFTFDPKLGVLADPTRTGSITMASPQATDRYRAQLRVSPLGRTRACSIPHNGMDVTGLELCP